MDSRLYMHAIQCLYVEHLSEKYWEILNFNPKKTGIRKATGLKNVFFICNLLVINT